MTDLYLALISLGLLNTCLATAAVIAGEKNTGGERLAVVLLNLSIAAGLVAGLAFVLGHS